MSARLLRSMERNMNFSRLICDQSSTKCPKLRDGILKSTSGPQRWKDFSSLTAAGWRVISRGQLDWHLTARQRPRSKSRTSVFRPTDPTWLFTLTKWRARFQLQTSKPSSPPPGGWTTFYPLPTIQPTASQHRFLFTLLLLISRGVLTSCLVHAANHA